MNKINGKTKVTGIVGYPIEHTFSPGMHNAAYEYLGLDFVYTPFSVNPQNLKYAIKNTVRVN